MQKILPSGTTNYVYDDFGRLLAEYSTNPAQAPCWTCYLSYDHLGSVRMVTSGNLQFIARHDFLPFGEELPPNSAGRNSQWGPANDNVIQKFTGQARDQETGLDYFNARYFGAALGRFTSPDPGDAGADLRNPQSWNGYAYVLGNPLANTDLSGMDTNYAGLQQGVCPASQANCPMPGQTAVGTPSVSNEINAAEARYVQEVVVPGFSGIAPPHVTSAPLGEAVSATIFYGVNDLTKQVSASMVGTSNSDDPSTYDVPVGIDIWKGQQKLWSNTATAGNVLATATAALVVAPIAIDTVASLPTMEIAVGPGQPFHVAFGANSTWLHATGDFFDMTIGSERAAAFARMAWFKFSVPILSPQAVLGTAGATASTCVTGACYSFLKGWGF